MSKYLLRDNWRIDMRNVNVSKVVRGEVEGVGGCAFREACRG
jgi:hypothetical protein